MMLHLFVPRVAEHNIDRVKGVEKIGKVKKMERIGCVREVKEVIGEIR